MPSRLEKDIQMSLTYRFRQIKKLPGWLYAPPALMIKSLRHLMRTETIDPCDHMSLKTQPLITVTWHNRLLFFAAMFPKHIRTRTVAVISASRDGQYIADLIEQFGIHATRGSSSKKGTQALHGAFKAIADGLSVSFTPDGPRGPKYTMGRGPIYLASQTGRPIVPVAINYSDYWELGSWDRFQIPKPWAKITLEIGEAIDIPPKLSEDDLARWGETVREKLLAITRDKR
jgi:lysophospholipid acyltransferase (LPLAT)-like uncharacterized protein